MGFVTITMTIKLQDQTRLLDYHNHFGEMLIDYYHPTFLLKNIKLKSEIINN